MIDFTYSIPDEGPAFRAKAKRRPGERPALTAARSAARRLGAEHWQLRMTHIPGHYALEIARGDRWIQASVIVEAETEECD